MIPTVGGLLDVLGLLAPWDLAADWDNVGLQVGDRSSPVPVAAVALDPGEAELAFAARAGARLLVTHHPLLFRPLRRVDTATPGGRLVAEAVRLGLAVAAAHTNLDRAPGGLADDLATRLGLEMVRSLGGEVPGLLKLTVFVPQGHEDAVAVALAGAGAGRIGNYGGCSFACTGEGSFTPLEGAHPRIGRVGRRETVPEVRLETLVHRRQAAAAVAALRDVHPYEEPALDLYPVEGVEPLTGLGRVGEREFTLDALVGAVKEATGAALVRVSGSGPDSFRRVAVVPGSGGDLVDAAVAAGAGALVTGEVRYHQALEAASLGLWVVEAGHRATEAASVPLMARFLRGEARARGWEVGIEECDVRGDAFVTR